MISETIKYEDFDGNPQEETWHFHLTKADIVELQMEFGGTMEEGALEKRLKELFQTKDAKVIIKFFKDMITRSVGRRIEKDGKVRFDRTEDISNEFMQTEAYSAFFMELVTNAEKGAKFFNGLVPRDLAKNLDTSVFVQDQRKPQGEESAPEQDDRPAWEREGREPTRQELLKMPQEELVKLMQRKTAASK